MKRKQKKIWAYLDGVKLVEVLQAALDNNLTVEEVKRLLIKENPGHDVTSDVAIHDGSRNDHAARKGAPNQGNLFLQ